MLNVLRGALTRRMFFLFLGLSLLPTLVLLIVPTILQIRAEQNAIQELEQELQDKATEIFSRLADNKANHYKQVIQTRINFTNQIATQIQTELASDPILQTSDTITFSTIDFDTFYYQIENDIFYAQAPLSEPALIRQILVSRVFPTIRQAMENDPNICQILIQTQDGTTNIFPEANYSDFVTPPEINANDINLSTTFTIQDPSYLEISTPILLDDKVWGMINTKLCIDEIVDEVPKYGLAENGTLVLASSNGDFLAIPDWGQDSFLLDSLNLPTNGSSPLFKEMVSADIEHQLSSVTFDKLLQEQEEFVININYDGKSGYLAGAPIEGLPIHVLLILPQEDIYNQASFYGARFQVSIPAIILQATISVVGFILVITFGALFSLRQLAGSINDLSSGAISVAKGDLSQRVPETGIGEMQQLARAFNSMVDSIQESRQSLQNKQAEITQTLETREWEFQLINQIAEKTTAGGSLTQKLSETLEMFCDKLSIHTATVYLPDSYNHLLPTVRYNTQKKPEYATRQMNIARKALAGQNTIIISRDQTGQNQILVAVPISYHERIVGILVCEWTENNRFSDHTLTFLEAVANHMAVLIENIRLRNQERSLLVTEERNRIARELHDSVTQTLFSQSMIAEGLKLKLDKVQIPEGADGALDMLIQQSLKIRSDLRAMIQELRPLTPDTTDLEEVIRSHVGRVERTTKIKISINIEAKTQDIPVGIQQNLDRITQEALSNIARHSQATQANINIAIDENILKLIITDNGIGFTPQKTLHLNTSFGLMNIRERAELMGGTFSIESAHDEGTNVSISIPLTETH